MCTRHRPNCKHSDICALPLDVALSGSQGPANTLIERWDIFETAPQRTAIAYLTTKVLDAAKTQAPKRHANAIMPWLPRAAIVVRWRKLSAYKGGGYKVNTTVCQRSENVERWRVNQVCSSPTTNL